MSMIKQSENVKIGQTSSIQKFKSKIDSNDGNSLNVW